MKTTTLTRKLPALVLACVGGQFALASGAGAQGLLNLLVPPPPRPPAQVAAPAPATATPVQVEQKLAALKYDVGPVDGNIDEQASSAVMAFQKVSGLPRTGELTPPVSAQIMATPAPPGPLLAGGEPNRIEISLAHQVLFLYENGALTKILPVSSGTSETPTPTGTFRIFRQESGWHTSRLGRLHNAQYFIGGYAIHGSTSVPAEPASHGCVRIPMSASEWFPSHVSKGMQVFIAEG
ncbi:MAG TPA: L,D-transpeptidase family protein [Acidimicrobiales bacterium]|nr:L,D-transpeptidase family protein [Acidimicrobiales bacterium]